MQLLNEIPSTVAPKTLGTAQKPAVNAKAPAENRNLNPKHSVKISLGKTMILDIGIRRYH